MTLTLIRGDKPADAPDRTPGQLQIAWVRRAVRSTFEHFIKVDGHHRRPVTNEEKMALYDMPSVFDNTTCRGYGCGPLFHRCPAPR